MSKRAAEMLAYTYLTYIKFRALVYAFLPFMGLVGNGYGALYVSP